MQASTPAARSLLATGYCFSARAFLVRLGGASSFLADDAAAARDDGLAVGEQLAVARVDDGDEVVVVLHAEQLRRARDRAARVLERTLDDARLVAQHRVAAGEVVPALGHVAVV